MEKKKVFVTGCECSMNLFCLQQLTNYQRRSLAAIRYVAYAEICFDVKYEIC